MQRARVAPFARLFPDAQQMYRSASREVAVPEIGSMQLYHDAAHLQSESYSLPEDYAAVIEYALYCPVNNIVMAPGRRIVAESMNIPVNKLDLRALRIDRVTDLSGTYALFRSQGRNYYHTLIDNLPRVLVLARPSFSDLGEIRLACPGEPTPTESFFLERLGFDNVTVTRLAKDSLYRMERLVFTPFKSGYFSGYLPEWYVQTFRSCVLPNRPSRRNRRILISREKAARQQRNFANNSAVDALLEKLGFEKQFPECLPLESQVEMFYDAEVIVAAHGAGLTNILYAPRGLKVVELFASTQINPAYYLLARSLGHEYRWICGRGQTLHPAEFEVDLESLSKALHSLDIS